MSSQKILRIIGIVLLLWLVFSLGVIIYALNSCNKNQIEYYESGDFRYTIIKDEGEKLCLV